MIILLMLLFTAICSFACYYVGVVDGRQKERYELTGQYMPKPKRIPNAPKSITICNTAQENTGDLSQHPIPKDTTEISDLKVTDKEL